MVDCDLDLSRAEAVQLAQVCYVLGFFGIVCFFCEHALCSHDSRSERRGSLFRRQHLTGQLVQALASCLIESYRLLVLHLLGQRESYSLLVLHVFGQRQRGW
jgi:hypothetical protein